jgi:hypothetical protein
MCPCYSTFTELDAHNDWRYLMDVSYQNLLFMFSYATEYFVDTKR